VEVNLKKAGYYGDGGNLFLQTSNTLSKSWIFRYVKDGKKYELGLGSLDNVSLADAREKASEYRKLLADGNNPFTVKRSQQLAAKLAEAKMLTFEECGNAYIETHKHGWKNPKHIQQWQNSLSNYVYPIIGKLAVADIDTILVTKCLEPIWITKNETASRIRGRIESILGWATVRQYRTGDNPARWRGHLDNLLSAPSKIQKENHHSALPYAQIALFIADLRFQESVGAACLEFTILTVARTNEAIGATWDEIDLDNRVWIISAARMKMKKEHRVPLSEPVLAILQKMQSQRHNDYIFANATKGLSSMAMLQVLKRMGQTDITVHGFRSTFRDWAAECTDYPNEVVEMALAHTIKNAAEAAYIANAS
jgi:integrase